MQSRSESDKDTNDSNDEPVQDELTPEETEEYKGYLAFIVGFYETQKDMVSDPSLGITVNKNQIIINDKKEDLTFTCSENSISIHRIYTGAILNPFDDSERFTEYKNEIWIDIKNGNITRAFGDYSGSFHKKGNLSPKTKNNVLSGVFRALNNTIKEYNNPHAHTSSHAKILQNLPVSPVKTLDPNVDDNIKTPEESAKTESAPKVSPSCKDEHQSKQRTKCCALM